MFCTKCGEQIIDTAKFCPKCGNAVGQIACEDNFEPLTRTEEKEYVLTVSREKQVYAVNPSIKILIDEKLNYAVENGQSIRIPITAGEHKITFSCSIRNKVVSVKVTQNLELGVKFNRLTGSIDVKGGKF